MYLKAALIGILVAAPIGVFAIFRNLPHTVPVTAVDHAVAAPPEQVEIDTSPKLVKTETIIPVEPEVKKPEVKKPEVKVVEIQKPEPRRERDLCTRHGMHKVHTRRGRSWRCRR
jgi:hypothetical protein